MRLVHLSDLHLGYRQYQRLTPLGVNQREADVARSFEYVIGKTIELRPDMVLIAGDVFHHVRPTNRSILHAFHHLRRLQRELPETQIVMVSGNHDTPRASETGSILRLFSSPSVHVVEGDAQRLTFPEWDVSVLAIPDLTRGGLRNEVTIDPSARHNVLLLHGALEGMLPAHLITEEYAATEISPAELKLSQWNYVALGHYHVYREMAPNAFYCGSIDYTSVNAWGEKIEEAQSGIRGKGFIEYDLEQGTHRFHDIPASRPLIDLRVEAKGLTAAEVDQRIAAAIESVRGGIDDKIVRLVARDLPRHIGRELDHKALREYKRRALHFQLDPRRPDLVRSIGQGAPGRRPSLAEVVREKLATRDIEPDIDRGSLVELGLRYLKEAEGAAVPSAMAVEE